MTTLLPNERIALLSARYQISNNESISPKTAQSLLEALERIIAEENS